MIGVRISVYLFTIIFIVTIGAIFLGIGIWHESTWWRRSNWHHGRGVIIGYKEHWGSDGTSYPPVVEYRFSNELRSFVSIYMSDKKPAIGTEVAVMISPDGLQAEIFSLFNRVLFTIGPGGLGLMVVLLVLTSIPYPPETDRGETREAHHDPRTLDRRNSVAESPEQEVKDEVGNVERFLEENRGGFPNR